MNTDEKLLLHYMYNSREKMTTKTATKLIYKGNTFCRKLLKNLEKKFAKWHGTSVNDRTQYYTLNF